MKPGDIVVISDRYPLDKARLYGIQAGDRGLIQYIFGHVAIVQMAKGFSINSNVEDLMPVGGAHTWGWM